LITVIYSQSEGLLDMMGETLKSLLLIATEDRESTGTGDQTGTDQTGTDQTGTDQTGTDQTGTGEEDYGCMAPTFPAVL